VTTPPRHAKRGANAVEFALVLPLLLMFLGGIFDYSIYFMTRSATYRAALEGARAGAMGDVITAPGLAEAAFRSSLIAHGYDDSTTTVTSSLVMINSERNVSMDVETPFTPPFGLASVIVPTSVRFTLSMRLEDQG